MVHFKSVVYEDENKTPKSAIHVHQDLMDLVKNTSPKASADYAFKCMNMLASSMLDLLPENQHMEFIEAYKDNIMECDEETLQKFFDNKIK